MIRCIALLAAIALAAACERPSTQLSADSGDARRIVTLAPHLAELVIVAGAGERLVGVSAYSDYPPAALDIPVVSDAFTVDQELLAGLAPDLLLAWASGTPRHVVDELRAAGYRVETIKTQSLDEIGLAIEQVGSLTGSGDEARRVADEFRRDLAAVRTRYEGAAPLTVFYQVSARPLFTVSARHYIGEIVGLCGGVNVFAGIAELAPAVTVEAVVARDPEAILASSIDGTGAFADWQRWPHLAANRYGNHFLVDADRIARPSLRLIAAAEEVCSALTTARENRARSGEAAD